MSTGRPNKRDRNTFERESKLNQDELIKRHDHHQQVEPVQENAPVLPPYPSQQPSQTLHILLELVQAVYNQLLSKNYQKLQESVTTQIATIEKCLSILQNAQKHELKIYDQIKQVFLMPIPSNQIVDRVNQINNHLEENWQKEKDVEAITQKGNFSLIETLLQAAEETFSDALLAEVIRFYEKLDKLRIQCIDRDNERTKIRDKIANLLVSNSAMQNYAQQLQGLSTTQITLMLYQQLSRPVMQIQALQQPPQTQPKPQQPPLSLAQQTNFLRILQEHKEMQERALQNNSPQRRPELIENLSVSLARGLATAGARLNLPMNSPVILNSRITDISQRNLIFRINEYLSSQNIPKISEDGYCHGIDLVWILMNDWGLGDAYNSMVETIAGYQSHQSHKIGPLILFFVRLIKLGQNPEKYSNGTCTQQDLPTLFGNMNPVFSFDGYFTKEELKIELLKNITPNSKPKITIQGFGILKRDGKPSGHTVSAITLANNYKFHDSNYIIKKDRYLNSIDEIVEEAWKQIFLHIEGGPKPRFIINAVKSQPKPSWLIELAGFFNNDKNLVEAIVGAPVQEEKAQAQPASIPTWKNTF